MPTDRFPYDLPSREALIRLINETYPDYELGDDTTEFNAPFFAPTSSIPGRTYIEAEATLLNRKHWFVYRRLDLGVTFPHVLTISVAGVITPRKIVEEVNRVYNMRFDPTDVRMDDFPLAPSGYSVTYRLRALPGSYVWFGSALIDVNAIDVPLNVRVSEEGVYRLSEEGTIRLMENQFL